MTTNHPQPGRHEFDPINSDPDCNECECGLIRSASVHQEAVPESAPVSESKWAGIVGRHNNNSVMGEVWDNVKKNRGSERAEPPGEALSEAADEIALVLKWMRDNEPVTVSQVAEVLRNREGVNRIEAIRRARATPPPTAEAENAETIAWLQKVYAMGVSENSVVPQQNAGEMLARLDELGFGKQEPRRGNTLWAMVMDAADEVERLRAATAPTADHEPAWVDKAIEEIRSRWPNEVLNIDIQFSGYCYITRTLDGRVRAIAEGETLIAALTSARTEKGKPNAN